RVGVIGALGVGAAFLVAEAAQPGSARAIVKQAGHNVSSAINSNIDDPVALREQLRDLESQYPKKIEAVRGDLAELEGQIAQFERELAVAERVVALADQDLGEMQHLLAKAEDARSTHRIVRVRFDNESMDMSQAYAKAERIQQLRDSYANRASEIGRDLTFLTEQESHFGELLTTLETERAQFQNQLWQLDQEIDAIARNERLLEILEDRQRTLDEMSPYSADSLDQVTSRISSIKAEQKARMEALTNRSLEDTFLDRANVEVGADATADITFEAQLNDGLDEIEIGEPVEPEFEVRLPGLETN
ncbi:MAG: hypothetical protein AAFO89_15405, partial [Planctomycetota bacterium]